MRQQAVNGPYFIDPSTRVFSVKPKHAARPRIAPTSPPPRSGASSTSSGGYRGHLDERTLMTIEHVPGDTGQMTSVERHPRRDKHGQAATAPSEKYELFLAVLTGQMTQQEAGERWGIDGSAVVSICMTARQGALRRVVRRDAPDLPQGWDARGIGGGTSGNRTAARDAERARRCSWFSCRAVRFPAGAAVPLGLTDSLTISPARVERRCCPPRPRRPDLVVPACHPWFRLATRRPLNPRRSAQVDADSVCGGRQSADRRAEAFRHSVSEVVGAVPHSVETLVGAVPHLHPTTLVDRASGWTAPMRRS